MMYRSAAAFLQRQVARSRLGTHLTIKLKHQCDAIIGRRLGLASDFAINGENWLIDLAAPHAAFFIDVGANVGNWSRRFAAKMPGPARGLALEPAPATAAALRGALADYPGIHVLEVAASDAAGDATFYAEDNAGETSSFIRAHSLPNSWTIRVKVKTIDTLLMQHTVQFVDFLKIDAEGFDFHVISGASEAFRSRRIGAVQFEYSDAWIGAGSTLHRAHEFLTDFGYKVFLLKGPRLSIIDPGYFGEFFRHSIFVASLDDTAWMRDAMTAATKL